MHYSDAYRHAFENLGFRLAVEDGCTAQEIIAAESRLGISLPESLRTYYLLAGNEKHINRVFNRLLRPTEWFVDSQHLVFMEENQRVVFWGIPATRSAGEDQPVFQGVNRDAIQWHPEHESCGTFLQVMIAWHAAFGGAGKHYATAVVPESETHVLLDTHWRLIGEVNSMRAYSQTGATVCLVQWPDMFQSRKKPIPWRVFAAAAAQERLDEVQKQVPGDWEAWG